jgi:glycosyltransferase involved in cell wall biosynthesis
LDWCLTGSKHLLIDSPRDCAWFEMGWDLPAREDIVPHDRSELAIPESAIVIVTAGRHAKFQEPRYWKAISDLLEENGGLYSLAIGVTEPQLPFLGSAVSASVMSRIRFMGWRGTDDYLRLLCLADVLVDTYPQGGGNVVLHAMGFGIPVVTFANNYMQVCDQGDWSPAMEFLGFPELVCARGDFADMKCIVRRLIEDAAYRQEIGRKMEAHIRQTRGNPATAVRDCEEALLRILAIKAAEAEKKDAEAAD